MVGDGTFKKIDEQDEVLGPAAVLVCGFGSDIERTLKRLLDDIGACDHRILLCTEKMVKQPLGQALETEPSSTEPAAPDKLPRAMVLSGMTGSQLKSFLEAYQGSGLPKPIFASVTEANLKFPVGKLLVELLREQRAMVRRR